MKQCKHSNIHQFTPNLHLQTAHGPKCGGFQKIYAYTCKFAIWLATWLVIRSHFGLNSQTLGARSGGGFLCAQRVQMPFVVQSRCTRKGDR